MKRIIPVLLISLMVVGAAFAQDAGGDTDNGESDGPETTVQIFFVACDDQGVMNLTGFATPGFDIFYQLFNGSNGTGDTLTSLRRANVDGDYAFSEGIAYRDGLRVAPGAIASARVIIAATNTPDAPVFETFVDDIQDGCNDAQNPLQSSDDAGDPVSASSVGDSLVGEIANPDGGALNEDFIVTPEPQVVLGPRGAGAPAPGRTTNPGLIFASCDSFYPDAAPGLIYDSDNVRVFWYWFADSPETLEQNLSVTNFQVKINQAPVSQVNVSGIQERGGLFYVFYTVPVGNLRPGFYEVEYQQTWTEPINDGFDEYGPGTPNPLIKTNCNFKVEPNPTGATVAYSGLYIGGSEPAHNFERNIVQQRVLRDFFAQTGASQSDTP